MKIQSRDGPMLALKCKAIYFNEQINRHSNIDVYQIFFEDNCRLAATNLHAFLIIRKGRLKTVITSDLHRGDVVWVDISAFSADGSFYREKAHLRKITSLSDDLRRSIRLKSIIQEEPLLPSPGESRHAAGIWP